MTGVLPTVAETTQFADPMSLERVLAGMEWNVHTGHRPSLEAGEKLPVRTGIATLGYVSSGRVTGASGEHRIDLPEGGAFVATGRVSFELRADAGAELVIAELDPAPDAPPAIDLIPDVLSVRRFAEVEPTIAAIARDIGAPACGQHRAADGTICALMATTVVLAAIRAWAEAGCAPTGWPARSADPFLARVLDAIHDEPGRPWSVGELASLGAMSRSVFADRFRVATGRTPAAYLSAVRIDAAKSMLASGASVSDTARRLGYASDEGFSRAFRRGVGLAPSMWRARPDPAPV